MGMIRGVVGGAALTLAAGCFDGSPTLDGTDGSDTGGSSSSGPVVADVTGMPPDPDGTGGSTGPITSGPADTGSEDTGGSTGSPGCVGDCPVRELDVVFVVDNSGSMGLGQARLAAAVPALLAELSALEAAAGQVLDLHIAVTTTDFGNPLCTPFQPAGYEPARGEPIGTACTERLQDFTGLTGSPVLPEVCTDVCPVGVEPTDPYVAIMGGEDNVPEGTPLEALQCLLPQGVNGCGFESPLETMLQSLNPGAVWNTAPSPLIREGADLALVLLTDELDCSVLDFSIMEDETLMNTNPDTGLPAPSSAICWNAGVVCDGPDAMGLYGNCGSAEGLGLHDVSRYTNYLIDELAGSQGKEVMMLTLNGVPPVTQHGLRPPYEPQMGGVYDLVVREWIDGEYPLGDILPEQWAQGVTAADKEFQLGVGPGCTHVDPIEGSIQALPPVRVREVCEALDGQGGPHCCMESICDDDYGAAMTCLRGMIESTGRG